MMRTNKFIFTSSKLNLWNGLDIIYQTLEINTLSMEVWLLITSIDFLMKLSSLDGKALLKTKAIYTEAWSWMPTINLKYITLVSTIVMIVTGIHSMIQVLTKYILCPLLLIVNSFMCSNMIEMNSQLSTMMSLTWTSMVTLDSTTSSNSQLTIDSISLELFKLLQIHLIILMIQTMLISMRSFKMKMAIITSRAI